MDSHEPVDNREESEFKGNQPDIIILNKESKIHSIVRTRAK